MPLTNKARAGFSSITIRGGRITMWEGQAASFSPQLGNLSVGVSGVAMAAALALTPGAAEAGECLETAPGSNEFECSGAAAPGTDTTQTIIAAAPVTITTAPGFGIDVTGGSSFQVDGNGGVAFTDVNASPISGLFGISLLNFGSGTLTLDTNGSIVSRAQLGVYVLNGAGTSDVSLSLNNTTGASSGVVVQNSGNGSLNITSTGTATGTSLDGISAFNYGTDLTINANNTSGGLNGIYAYHYGSGAVTISSTGTASGGTGDGIRLISYSGTGAAVAAAASTGAANGIFVQHYGSGALSISSVSATGASGNGVYAYNSALGTTLSITSGTATGRTTGISAFHRGRGALTITATGTATGSNHSGIVAITQGTASSLSVTAADTTGGSSGIDVTNGGIGALTIVSTGTATSNAGTGIAATNRSTATDLMITANGTAGGIHGISADNYGTGAVSITATGTASGGSGSGIRVNNYNGTDAAINAATSSGGANGILALHYGTGALTIASAAATGTAGIGINAYAAAAGTALTITSGNATGGANGIHALSNGLGALTITSTGTASGTGTNANGILAFNSANGTSLTVNVANATGTDSGIVTRGYGSGANTINLTGTAQGGTGSAIDTFTGAGRLTTINLASGAQVLAGSSGIAIRNDAGNSIVNLASGVTLAGAVRLGDGADTFNVNGPAASYAGVILDGGDDASGADGAFDTLNLNNGWSGSLVGANTLNWELINLNSGSLMFSDAAITAGAIWANGGGRLNGSNGLVVTGTVGINAGSALLAGDNAGTNAMRIIGDLMNMGTIDLRGPMGTVAAGDRLTVGGSLSGAAEAQIIMDVRLGGGTSDQLIVGGNLSGRSLLVLNDAGGTGGLTTGDGILLVDVAGTSSADALVLAGGAFDVGAFRYVLNKGGGAGPDWFLRSRARNIVVSTVSIAQTTRTLGLASLGTLNERAGEQENMTRVGGESGFMKGAWLRAFGSGYSDTVTSDTLGDSRSNGQYGGLHLGVDLYRGVSASGSRTSVGIFGGMLWAGSDDKMTRPLVMDAGSTRADGYTIGGYVTHVSVSDWYVDLAGQRQSLDHFATALDGTTAHTGSDSWYASVELGKAFGTKWQIEPQVQLIYGNTDVDDFADSDLVANRIAIDDSVTGRAGFRLKRTWDNDLETDAGVFSVYAKANVWRQLSGGETALVIGASAPALLQFRETWGDVGLGSTFSLGQNVSAFVDAEVEFGLDQDATALSGRTGIMLRF